MICFLYLNPFGCSKISVGALALQHPQDQCLWSSRFGFGPFGFRGDQKSVSHRTVQPLIEHRHFLDSSGCVQDRSQSLELRVCHGFIAATSPHSSDVFRRSDSRWRLHLVLHVHACADI